MKTKHFSVIGLVILFITMFSDVKAQPFTNDKESASIFVQRFYDWYNELYNTSHAINAFRTKSKAKYFDINLLNTYSDYCKAQPNNIDIVVDDVDPILGAQDNGFDYFVGAIKQVNDKYFVDIHAGEGSSNRPRTDILKQPTIVIAEVVNQKGQWKFVNFFYPRSNGSETNLLDLLKVWKKEGQKYVASHQTKSQNKK